LFFCLIIKNNAFARPAAGKKYFHAEIVEYSVTGRLGDGIFGRGRHFVQLGQRFFYCLTDFGFFLLDFFLVRCP